MKIRTIKPEFWKSPSVQELTYMGRLLLIGLFNYVDDNGMGLDSPSLIAAEIFPKEMDENPEETKEAVDAALWDLHRLGIALRVTGQQRGSARALVGFPNWAKHQSISKPRVQNGYTPLDSPNVQVRELPEQLPGNGRATTGQCPGSDGAVPVNRPDRNKEQGTRKESINNVQNVTTEAASSFPQPGAATSDETVLELPLARDTWAPSNFQEAQATVAGLDPDELVERLRIEDAAAPPGEGRPWTSSDFSDAYDAIVYEARLQRRKATEQAFENRQAEKSVTGCDV